MHKLTLPSPAKINRFLHIVGRREDGYHLLQTLFQYVDIGDTLHFEVREDAQIVLSPQTHLGISSQDNLIFKAAKLLQEKSKTTLGVTIQWQKILPLGSGLGGGSSNAATVLVALNQLWNLNYSKQILIELGVRIGADVPFFIFGHSAFAEGIGEQLSAFTFPPCWILILVPDCHVNTAKMYAAPELTRSTPRLRIEALVQGETKTLLKGLKNDFEPVVRRYHPEVDEALKWLSNFSDARLSGSGASVFACFDSLSEAQAVAESVPAHWTKFVAKGLNHSPLYEAIDFFSRSNFALGEAARAEHTGVYSDT